MLTGILVAIALLLLAGIVIFNRLVADRNQMRAAWSDIDVQLMRRHDLTPQLVTAVKAYAAHERDALETLTELRARTRATAALADRARVAQHARPAVELEGVECDLCGEEYALLRPACERDRGCAPVAVHAVEKRLELGRLGGVDG